MAKCKNCGEKINWATVKNGNDAGKKRPFDEKGNAEGGLFQYALTDSGEIDQYEQPILEARFFDDPIEGLENNEVLYRNHFKSCTEKGDYKKGKPSKPSGKGAFVSVEVGGVRYSGNLMAESGAGDGSADEAF